MHVVQVGNFSQLPGVSQTSHHIRHNMKVFNYFQYEEQLRSVFERLYKQERAPQAMLDVQYHMHPAIRNLHSTVFYNGEVKNGKKVDKCWASYNYGPLAQYKPFTFINTSEASNRYEQNLGDGKYINSLEANQVENIIEYLIKVDDLRTIWNNIAVIAPYRAQVDHIRQILEAGVLQNIGLKTQLNILIATVDAMQGGEKMLSFSLRHGVMRTGRAVSWKIGRDLMS